MVRKTIHKLGAVFNRDDSVRLRYVLHQRFHVSRFAGTRGTGDYNGASQFDAAPHKIGTDLSEFFRLELFVKKPPVQIQQFFRSGTNRTYFVQFVVEAAFFIRLRRSHFHRRASYRHGNRVLHTGGRPHKLNTLSVGQSGRQNRRRLFNVRAVELSNGNTERVDEIVICLGLDFLRQCSFAFSHSADTLFVFSRRHSEGPFLPATVFFNKNSL